MQTRRKGITVRTTLCCTLLALTCATANAQAPATVNGQALATENAQAPTPVGRPAQHCGPGVLAALTYSPAYKPLLTILGPERKALRELLDAVVDQASYEALLKVARSIAQSTPNGRLLITLPDGTVVLDTANMDDPTDGLESGNSYGHFQSKTVNENHNSRIAIFAAQLYPCGIGVESKLSTTTDEVETYVAVRLGAHLSSSGTARLSVAQQGGPQLQPETDETSSAPESLVPITR
jgi:hypothetical protein